jgi:hypothetical protein
MDMQLNTYRGYSAYELAVKNGFRGTLEDWLNSLRGSDGQTTSVNGVQQQNGNVAITGADIPVSATDSRTLSDLAAILDRIISTMSFTDEALDLGGRYLENARFR